jgi:hypothetical protein
VKTARCISVTDMLAPTMSTPNDLVQIITWVQCGTTAHLDNDKSSSANCRSRLPEMRTAMIPYALSSFSLIAPFPHMLQHTTSKFRTHHMPPTSCTARGKTTIIKSIGVKQCVQFQTPSPTAHNTYLSNIRILSPRM